MTRVNPDDALRIVRIVNRVAEAVPMLFQEVTKLSAIMDIEFVHCNIYTLDLEVMVDWPRTSDLVHDVAGIVGHINRRTGELDDCFTPRFTKPLPLPGDNL